MSARASSKKRRERISAILVNGSLILLVLIWTIPTIGLLVSSFRTRDDIATSGWWQVLPHREWEFTEEFEKPEDVDPDGVMTIAGATGTFEEFREGIETGGGKRVRWLEDADRSYPAEL
jgi:alpha-glucoside transport system permease protein